MFKELSNNLLIGFIGVAIGGYFFVQYHIKCAESSSEKQKVLKLYDQVDNNQKFIFSQIKNTKKQQQAIILGVQPQCNEQTFNYIEKQISKYNYGVLNRQYLTNMTGGQFQFIRNGNPCVCEINNTIISCSALHTKKTRVKFFQQSKSQHLCYDFVSTLKKHSLFAIHAIISYDQVTKKFLVQPKFIATKFQQILQYWQDQQISYYGKQVVSGIAIAFFGYFFIIQPLVKTIKTYFQNRRLKKQSMVADDISFFKQKQYFSSKQQNKMKCMHCNKNYSDTVYECGHLCACEQCKNIGKIQCQICHKNSKRFMRIFIS